MSEKKLATFGAGCFWGVESAFSRLDGVLETAVGYMGGEVENPTYRMVCSGRTGHAEVLQLVYDPARVSYDQLLDLLWRIHDPTTLNRQGPDIGTQYRSAIFYHDDGQKAAAARSRDRLEKAGVFPGPVVTQIVPAGIFYPAEEYHQRYFEKMGIAPHCGVGGHR